MEPGFEFEGTWITDPHWEPSHRWRFDTEHDACMFYGFPDNFHKLWHATETKEKNNMNETTKKLRTILVDMITRQFKTDFGIDNRINLYMVEVQFIKDVVISLTGTDAEDSNKLHDWACDLVGEIHKEFGE